LENAFQSLIKTLKSQTMHFSVTCAESSLSATQVLKANEHVYSLWIKWRTCFMLSTAIIWLFHCHFLFTSCWKTASD